MSHCLDFIDLKKALNTEFHLVDMEALLEQGMDGEYVRIYTNLKQLYCFNETSIEFHEIRSESNKVNVIQATYSCPRNGHIKKSVVKQRNTCE